MYTEIFACPETGSDLIFNKGNLINSNNKIYYIKDNIVDLFYDPLESKKTSEVINFYTQYPFPNYENLENISSLIIKSKKSIFAEMLSHQLPPNKKILEVGSGTSQLSNFLSATTSSNVFACDATYNSLKLGAKFAKKNKLKGISFTRMNIFNPCFKENSFDFIICNGVLHHTINPYKGFKKTLSLLKNDGIIILGLYSFLARIKNTLFFLLSKVFGEKIFLLDPHIRKKILLSNEKKISWIKDQYFHPLEKRYFLSEILKWFRLNNIELLNIIPPCSETISKKNKLFESKIDIDLIDIMNFELQMLSSFREGGLFLLIGKKKNI